MKKRIPLLLSIFLLSIVSTAVAQEEATPSAPETPSALVRPHVVYQKPIPLKWKLGAAATVLIFAIATLVFSMRAWRSWNLFDREYRFPRVEKAALRLGANRSGGCMAAINFRDGPRSGRENS